MGVTLTIHHIPVYRFSQDPSRHTLKMRMLIKLFSKQIRSNIVFKIYSTAS